MHVCPFHGEGALLPEDEPKENAREQFVLKKKGEPDIIFDITYNRAKVWSWGRDWMNDDYFDDILVDGFRPQAREIYKGYLKGGWRPVSKQAAS